MDIKERLKALTAEYLSDDLNYGRLFAMTRELKAMLVWLSGTSHDTIEGRKPIHTDNGKAIGPFWAAMCVDDIMRTRRFVRGVYHALKDKLNEHNGEINVLYAGTGPFAMLILPSLLRFAPERIHYTFMEINPITIESLQSVLKTIGVDEYKIELVMADASRCELDKNKLPDLIISETMQNMLAREQQVPIFLNLMRQAKQDTVFIPESIELFVGVKPNRRDEEITREDYRKLDCLFAVNREAMAPLIKDKAPQSTETMVFNERQTLIKEELEQERMQPVLFTEVQVYKDERLLVNESGLTTPKDLLGNGVAEGQAMQIKSRYKIDKEPKLEYEISAL